MLNDLLAIDRGLAALGIDPPSRHPDIKDMAKGEALRVRLDHSGRIASIERLRQAGLGVVWTLRDAQQNGFPGLSTDAGLIVLDDPSDTAHAKAWDAAKTTSDRRNELLRLLDSDAAAAPIKAWPKPGHRQRIAQRLQSLRPLALADATASVPAASTNPVLSAAKPATSTPETSTSPTCRVWVKPISTPETRTFPRWPGSARPQMHPSRSAPGFCAAWMQA